MRVALVPVIAVGSFFAACCCCCGGGMTPEERAEWDRQQKEKEVAEEAAKQEAIARAPILEQSLGDIQALIDLDNPVQKVSCPVDEMRKNGGFGANGPVLREDLWFAAYEDLPGAEAFGDEAEGGNWKWMTHKDVTRVSKLSSENPDEFTRGQLGKAPNRYLVVFVGAERASPGKIEEGWLSSGFDGGSWDGGLVIVDLVDKKIVCSAPFAAENSETLDYDDRGVMKDDPTQVVLEDFEQNFENSANKALEGITSDFSVNVIGIF